jgi:hypothetical protein
MMLWWICTKYSRQFKFVKLKNNIQEKFHMRKRHRRTCGTGDNNKELRNKGNQQNDKLKVPGMVPST